MRTYQTGFIWKVVQTMLFITAVTLFALFGLVRACSDGVSSVGNTVRGQPTRSKPEEVNKEPIQREEVVNQVQPSRFVPLQLPPRVAGPHQLPEPTNTIPPSYTGPVIVPKQGESFTN